MHRSFFLFILIAVNAITANAQLNYHRFKLRKEINTSSSISSISIHQGLLYLPAERCNKIFVADIAMKKITDTLEFVSKFDLEIEGSAW